MPPATPKFAYGFVNLKKVPSFQLLKHKKCLSQILILIMDTLFFQVGNISDLLGTLSPLGPVQSQHPLTFEEVKQVCLKATTGEGLILQRQ